MLYYIHRVMLDNMTLYSYQKFSLAIYNKIYSVISIMINMSLFESLEINLNINGKAKYKM